MNEFADLSDAEFNSLLTYKPNDKEMEQPEQLLTPVAPIDWRELGKVASIRN